MNRILLLLVAFAAMALTSCQGGRWTASEKVLISAQGNVMRVLSVDDSLDCAVLRDTSCDLSVKELRGDLYELLCDKLVATVTDPSQDGVGIAGPQVGISRRIVAVQRFDKPDEPFEVYPNIRIVAMRGALEPGNEGCLSVPERYGKVLRSRDIDIEYTSLYSLRDTVETVTGFTAVIFQHECDHLDGIIFTDRQWAEPQAWCSSAGDACSNQGLADVFYICSTDVISSKKADGNESFNAVLDSAEREALKAEMTFVQAGFFPDSLIFYSPYYHQVTMNGFFDAESAAHFEKAALEVRDAFDYYMNHWNGGRPFILAGFSQGAMLTVDLLKHLTDEQYSRLVTAYVIGYGLDSVDVAHPHIVPATGSRDKGVCVSFNSVSDSSGIWPLVQHNAVTCINPVNWRTDATPAEFVWPFGDALSDGETASGSRQPGRALTVSLDTLRHVLIVPGFKAETTPFWPSACLHHYDLLFYAPHIRKNALERLGTYASHSRKCQFFGVSR